MILGRQLGRRSIHGIQYPLVPFINKNASVSQALTSKSTVALFGVPVDTNSSFLQGPAEAPDAIRHAILSDSGNGTTELNVDVGALQLSHLVDLGNVDCFDTLSSIINEATSANHRVMAFGGDHSITFPIIRGIRQALLAKNESRLNILHFDAHSDMYADDILETGNIYSHASPFARILENNLCTRLVQVGIRCQTQHLRDQAEKYNVEVHDMISLSKISLPKLVFDGPLYISIDLDCLDPAFAPGVSHYEPGGMNTRDVLTLLQTFQGDLIGADIVELNVARDIGTGYTSIANQTSPGMTAMVAAKFAKELLGRMFVP
ncbi:arginase [Thraustotheca clavata]|uniref:Arginase n=1 Tax=Thraustotheca clavata TaxID=74557 RepID=A0A1V9ZXP4_9STRA|nr:arginase [Thraustotheca clavata]